MQKNIEQIIFSEFSMRYRKIPPLIDDPKNLSPVDYVHIGDYYRHTLKWDDKMLDPIFDKAIIGSTEHYNCDHIGDSYVLNKTSSEEKQFTGDESEEFWQEWRKPKHFRKKPEPLIVYVRDNMVSCLVHDAPELVDINKGSYTIHKNEEEVDFNADGYICEVIEGEIIPKMKYKPIIIKIDSKSTYGPSDIYDKCKHNACTNEYFA